MKVIKKNNPHLYTVKKTGITFFGGYYYEYKSFDHLWLAKLYAFVMKIWYIETEVI